MELLCLKISLCECNMYYSSLPMFDGVDLLSFLLSLLMLSVSVAICFYDIRFRRIPNEALVFLLIIGYFYLAIYAYSGASVVIPCVCLVTGFALSAIKVIGMGDVKFLFISLLLSPAELQISLIYGVVFFGGFWSILWHFLISKLGIVKSIDTVQVGIPYAIPIAFALNVCSFVN